MNLFDFGKKKNAGLGGNAAATIEELEEGKARNLLDQRELEDRAKIVERRMREEVDALNRDDIGRADEEAIARRISLFKKESESLRERIAVCFTNAELLQELIDKKRAKKVMENVVVGEEGVDLVSEEYKEALGKDMRLRIARRELPNALESGAVAASNSLTEDILKEFKHKDKGRSRETPEAGRKDTEVE